MTKKRSIEKIFESFITELGKQYLKPQNIESAAGGNAGVSLTTSAVPHFAVGYSIFNKCPNRSGAKVRT
jgi:hypothetical protein